MTQNIPDLHYDLLVMVKMLEVLEPGVREPFLKQLSHINNDIMLFLEVMAVRDKAILDALNTVSLENTYITFDLEATRREYAVLRQKIEGLDNDNQTY